MIPAAANAIVMHEGLTRLASARELVERLPFSAVTVVLLTAAWSFDSNAAREALDDVRRVVDCGSLTVSYYELPLSILQLHHHADDDAPRPPVPFLSGDRWRTGMAAQNVTAGVPWFPCVRIFRGDQDSVIPSTHGDSFDTRELAGHVEYVCNACEHNLKQLSLSSEEEEGIAKTAVPSLSPLYELHTHAAPVSRDTFGRAMSKNSNPDLGVLFIVKGGISAIFKSHMDEWKAVAKAISFLNQPDTDGLIASRRWVISIADSLLDKELADRNAIQSSKGRALLMIDPAKDARKVHYIDENAKMERVLEELNRFARYASSMRLSRQRRRKLDAPQSIHRRLKQRVFSFWTRPSMWRRLFSQQSTVCFKGILEHNFDVACEARSWVWLVVYQPWCGFSQRILGYYRRLERLFRDGGVDSYVIEVTNVQELPEFLDKMVDGFPTVIRLSSDENGETVDEYQGPHHVEDILDAMCVDRSERLRELLMLNRSHVAVK